MIRYRNTEERWVSKNGNRDISCYTDVIRLFGYCDQNYSSFLYMHVSKFFFAIAPKRTFQSLVDPAPHRMRSRVYETVDRLSVCLSVCLSHRSTAAAACGGFAAERRAGKRYRSTVAGAGTQQQRRLSTALSSKRGQWHVDSRGTTLNTDWLYCIKIFWVIHIARILAYLS